MPFIGSAPSKTFQRTDGTRTGSQAWQQAKAAAVKIRADAHDTHDQDLGDAISALWLRDGGNQPTADLPLNSFKFTGVGSATARTHFPAMSQVQDSTALYAGTSAGTDTITATLSPAITAYAAGQRYHFKAGGTNTGAATINLNSVGAKDLKKGAAGSTALEAGDITAGGMYTVEYDGTNMQLKNPGTQNIAAQPLDELLTEIAALSTDPNADSGLFFDDSAGNMAYWTPTGALSFSGTNLAVASAADANVGVIEIATQAEHVTATDTVRAATPGRQMHHPAHLKAWASVNQAGAHSFNASFGMSSISDAAVGRSLLTFSTAFAATTYGAVYGASGSASSDSTGYFARNLGGTKSTTQFNVQHYYENNGIFEGAEDGTDETCAFIGNQ
jgi:hypothetical protein